jgi:hypothetical protein
MIFQVSDGDFILVGYAYKVKSAKKMKVLERLYVGCVQRKYVNRFYVKFLRTHRASTQKFVFPNTDDLAYVKVKEIKRVLPPPEEKRGIFCFSSPCYYSTTSTTL